MVDSNTSEPLWAATVLKVAPTRANASIVFGNSNVSVALTNVAVGVFGVDTQETTNTQVSTAATKMAHAGWVMRTAGMGGVATITANSGAYGTNSFVTFSNGGTGNTAANASVTVNQNGLINGVTINTNGLYLTTPTAVPVSGNAAFTITMGGRANRTQYETLVAAGSMAGANSTIS
jgi:hypothetical protein